jgi:hypothetical protein
MYYHLELGDEIAALYLGGTLSYEDSLMLCDVCRTLPTSVRTLRLDLHAIGAMSAEVMETVGALLRYWRKHRRGAFRLSTSYLLAACEETEISTANVFAACNMSYE